MELRAFVGGQGPGVARLGTVCAVALLSAALSAQFTPAPIAVKLPDSLVFVSTTAINHASLVWHPGHQRYHSLRIGNNSFPLETWLPTGGLSVSQTTCGVDSRGLWYNPNTGQVERNCFTTIGWATMDIDGALNATSGFTMLFTGQLQMTPQSMGAFDPVLNQFLSYSAGNVQFRSRNTGNIVQTLALTGTLFTNVNTESVIWTGQAGYEIGLLEWVNKRVLLFDRSTGALAATVQLPASAITHSQFRFCYTNDRVWLFNSTLRKWNAYCIWNQSCPMVLPVELIDFKAHCADGSALLKWSTATERNSSHFLIGRSTDMANWTIVDHVEAAGNSQQTVHYAWADPLSGPVESVYYRLEQVDFDGRSEVFPAEALAPCEQGQGTIALMPNPVGADGTCEVLLNAPPSPGQALHLLDPWGRPVMRVPAYVDDGPLHVRLELGAMVPGVYLVELVDATGARLATGRLVRH